MVGLNCVCACVRACVCVRACSRTCETATSGGPLVHPAVRELMGGWSTVKTGNTVMRRMSTFRSKTGRIYDGGPIRFIDSLF